MTAGMAAKALAVASDPAAAVRRRAVTRRVTHRRVRDDVLSTRRCKERCKTHLKVRHVLRMARRTRN